MKSFLVATDLSERSDRAVRRALRLAGEQGGVCHAIHVVDDAMPVDMAEKLRDDAEARLVRFVDTNKGAARTEVTVRIGDPVEEVLTEAKRLGPDLVVLGLHRRRGFLDRLRDTTMERLVRFLRTPVLLVRDPADHPYKSVLVPVSFSPACATAIAAVRKLAPEADLTIFHAIYLPYTGLTGERPGGAMDRELTAEARKAMADWERKEALPEISEKIDFLSGSLEDVMRRKLIMLKPDLVALGAHTRGPLASAVIGSFAADMIRNPTTDLLLAHP